MADYEYTNGEEYLDDPEFSSLVDTAYETVDEDMPTDTPIDWDVACGEYFDIEIADPRDKAAWTLHVYSRNAMMGAINHRAAMYGKSWRLYIAQSGKTILKAAGRRMVEIEIEKRMRKVGGSYALVEKRLAPMLSISSLTRRDRVVISQMIDVVRGARLATSGMVDRLDVPRKVRQMIQKQLEVSYPSDDTDE